MAFPNHIGRSFPTHVGRAFPVIGAGAFDISPTDPFFSSVVLGLEFNGNSGDQTATDFSNTPHTMTFGNSAFIDDTQGQHLQSVKINDGATVNPSQGFVSAPDHADWAFAAGDFTVELFVRFETLTGAQLLISQYNNSANQRAWYLAKSAADELLCFFSDDGTSAAPAFQITSNWPGIATDTWFHTAMERKGSIFSASVAGQVVITGSSAISLKDSTSELWIGKFRSTGFDDSPTNGWIDGVRITKGVARYDGVSSFAIPSLPYPTA